MDELNQLGAPAPGPQHEAHPAGARRLKRRLMFGLIGLYAFSVVAAAILVVRGQNAPAPRKPGDAKGAASASGGSGLLGLSDKDAVGWVAIHGPIMSSEAGKPWERGVEQWSRKLRQMSEAKGVKAIVLD